MKKAFLTCFLLSCLVSATMIQGQEVKVTFQVFAPTLSDSAAVYIAGNHEKLGNWNPGKIRLNKIKKILGDLLSNSSPDLHSNISSQRDRGKPKQSVRTVKSLRIAI